MQTNQCAVYLTTLPLDGSVRRHKTSNLGVLLEDIGLKQKQQTNQTRSQKKASLSEQQSFTPAFGHIEHAADMQMQMLYVHLEGASYSG